MSCSRRIRWIYLFGSLFVSSMLACATPVRAGAPSQVLPGSLQGKSVVEALRALTGPTLQFVFSSQLLPDSLRVTSEPDATGVEAARSILAVHGLELQPLQPGLYAVIRSAAPLSDAAAVREGSATTPVEGEEPLFEVVISASRYRVGESVSSLNLLDAEALQTQPGLGDDAVRSLQRLPGIAHDGISARSNVRGGESSETLLLLDGYPLRQAFHQASYQSLFSVIDSGLVSSADVYTGGFPARYGNRMSSVFDFHSRETDASPRRSVALDFFNASARVAGGGLEADGHREIAPPDWLAAARVGTLRPLLAVIEPSVGSPRYADAYLRVGAGDVSTLRVTGNVLLARDELSIYDSDSEERGELEGRSRYFWLRLDREWNAWLRTSLWLGQTRIESARAGTAAQPRIATGSVDDRRSSHLTDVRTRVDWQFHPNHLLQTGFELTDEEAKYAYDSEVDFSAEVASLFGRSPDVRRALDLLADRRRGAVFLSHRWRINDAFTTEIGARAQRLLTRGLSPDWISEPRLGLRWQLAPATRLQFNWGRFHQVDEINELQIEDGVDQFAAPQRSEQLIFGVEHRVSARFALRMEAYHKVQSTPRTRYENLLDLQSIFPEIAADRVAVRPTRARIDGIELSGSLDQGRLHGWASAGWSRAEDRVEDKWTPRIWDESWTLSGGLQWTSGPWEFGGQLDLHRGWPQTPLYTGANGQLLLGMRNAARLPLFAQLDLRAQYTRQLSRGELLLTAELMNAQGRANNCCTELVIRNGDLAARALHWLPIVPSLGIRWNF